MTVAIVTCVSVCVCVFGGFMDGGYDYVFTNPDIPDEFVCTICTMVHGKRSSAVKLLWQDILQVLSQAARRNVPSLFLSELSCRFA